MNKKLLILHAIGAVGVFTVLTVYLFYQVFVTDGYQKISIKQFFTPSTLSLAARMITTHTAPPKEDIVYLQKGTEVTTLSSSATVATIEKDARLKIFVVDGTTYLTSMIPGTLTVTNLATAQTTKIPLDLKSTYEIIGWFDTKHMIVSQKNDTYSILKINLDENSQKPEVLVDSVAYADDHFSTFYGSKLTTMYYTECNPICNFIIFDIEKKQQTKKIPAFTDASHAAHLKDVKMLFFDPTRGYIAYEVPGSKEVYVIDTDLNFLQLIRLENKRNTAEFVGYYPQTEQLVFRLHEKDGSRQTIALYAANKPSLHLHENLGDVSSIVLSPRANVYQVESQLLNLNGEPVSKEVSGRLIPAY